MLKFERFAAIDIGSNAIRLLVMNVFDTDPEPVFQKCSLIRVPVRLGEDAFLRGAISENNIHRLIESMEAYKQLMDVFGVKDYRGSATSAMRESSNGLEVIEKIREETGIDIEIISGDEEADIIYSTQIAEHLNPEKNYLYVDVGGGSTECTLISSKERIASRSFNIGTIRILKGTVTSDDWKDMKKWLQDTTAKYRPVSLIGSGGNINKLFKMAGLSEKKPLGYGKLKKMYAHINAYTVEERIRELNLNIDRADVIIPATEIFLTVMKATRSKTIIVPKIGLADGLVRRVFSAYKEASQSSVSA